MMKEESNKTGDQYQRMTWDALRKSLNGLINKVNVKNVKDILPEIFSEVCMVMAVAEYACIATDAFEQLLSAVASRDGVS